MTIGEVALGFFRLPYPGALTIVVEILREFFDHFGGSDLMNNMGIPNPEMISDLMKYYKDKNSPFTLKGKILGLFAVFMSEDYREIHFSMTDIEFFRRIKEDMLFDLEKSPHVSNERNYFFNFFGEAVEFFESMFQFNDYSTNSGVCEDLEFEYLLIDAFVKNASVPQVGSVDPR